MFDWLYEGRLTVYLVLAVVGLILLGLWVRDRRRGWLIAAGVVGLLVGAYALLDYLVETRREQIERKVHLMAAAVKKKDVNAIFQHISDRFQLGGLDKAAFRGYVEQAARGGAVTDLKVWGFEFPDATGNVHFFAKPESERYLGGGEFFLVRARFQQEAGNQWRLTTFNVFKPIFDAKDPLPLPPLR